MMPLHLHSLGALPLRIIIAILVAFSALATSPSPEQVQATTYVVNSTADSGAGSLRQAVASAASNDTITFNLTYPAVIALSSQITVDKNLTITGPGVDQLTISGQNATRIFYVSAGTLRLSQLKLADGGMKGQNAVGASPGSYGGQGGAIFVANGAGLTATNVTFLSNSAIGGNGANSSQESGTFVAGAGGGPGGAPNQTGGFGGGGGGGGGSTDGGGHGGFGGGGGGGSGGEYFKKPVPGGSYGGNGGSSADGQAGYGGGGGGAGLGGAIFIAGGGAVGLRDVTFSENEVVGGNGGSSDTTFGAGGGGGGAGLGSAVFNGGSLCVGTGVAFIGNTKTGGSAGNGQCGFGGSGEHSGPCPLPAEPGQAFDHSDGIFDWTNDHDCSVWFYPPTNLTFTPVALQENRPIGTVAGTFTATDPDVGDTFTYTLVSGTGSTDNASFAVSENQLVTAAVLDYESRSSYTVRVRTTDSHGKFLENTFTISILDINDPPTEIELSTSGALAENLPVGTLIGDLTVVDQDTPPHTLTLVTGGASCSGAGNSAFSLDGNQLKSARTFDFETQNHYEICVRATDSGSPGLSYDQSFAITITDVNEAPHELTLDGSTVAENEPAATQVGAFTTQDVDAGQVHTYSLVSGSECAGPDNASFAIVDDELLTHAVFDHETKDSYEICVRTTDSGDPERHRDESFTITITDVNEAPDGISLSAASLQENLPTGSVVGSFSASDPDAAQPHTFELTVTEPDCPGTHNDAFTLDGGQLKSALSFDYENQSSYEICVRTSDSGDPALHYAEPFTILIDDVNEAPTDIHLSTTILGENLPAGTFVGTLSASDPDNPPHSYQLVEGGPACSGADNDAFVIDGDQVKSAFSFNYEVKDRYEICVQATDSGTPARSLDRPFTISITDSNDVPEAIALSNSNILENLPIGSLVGNLTVTDPDSAQSHSFALVDLGPGCDGTDNDDFTLDGDRLLSASVFDHEVQASYRICVQVTDDGDPFLSLSVPFTIQIENYNEAPYAVDLSANQVRENEPVGTLVGFFSAQDTDAGQTHTYQLVTSAGGCIGADNAAFTIAGDELRTAQIFDFEDKASYEICVRATDSGSSALSLDQAFMIHITDVNEAPASQMTLPDQAGVAGQDFQYTVAEDAFSDPDGDLLVYSAALGGGPLPAWLAFDPPTRRFTGTPLRVETLAITVTVRDPDGETATAGFTLTITEQTENHPPVVVKSIPNVALTGAPFSISFSTGTFADFDGDPLSYLATLDSGDPLPGWLSFDPIGRTFSGTPPAGVTGVLAIRVTALDGRGGEVSTIFLLAVDENAPPFVLEPIPNQSAPTSLPWTFQVAAGTFSDPNADPLRYSASLADGSPLPGWLSFDPDTQTFSGTPPAQPSPLVYDLRVTASEIKSGGSVSSDFQFSPWSAELNASVPAGTRVTLVDRPGADASSPPAGVTRLDRMVEITIGYAGETLSDLTGLDIPVCFQTGPDESLLARGDLSRLVIGTTQGQEPWNLLPTRAVDSTKLCATVEHFSRFEVFLLPEPAAEERPSALPATGFAPGRVTGLLQQPPSRAYTDMGGVWMEIPSLRLKTPIFGVPVNDGNWDVSWLGNRAGWLEGSAFPGFNGNAAITAHVYGADGLPGPFVHLRTLRWGQQVVIHAFGQAYSFEIRSVDLNVSPDDLSALKHEERPWLTLITCQGFDPKSEGYRWRTVVRAVLVKIEKD